MDIDPNMSGGIYDYDYLKKIWLQITNNVNYFGLCNSGLGLDKPYK